MASQLIAVEDTDTYYVRAEKALLRMFETKALALETPQGDPTLEDDQGNVCLGPALLQPPKVFDSFYSKSECTMLLYEQEQDLSGIAQSLNFRHWPK